MLEALTEQCLFTEAITEAEGAAGVADITGATLDMSGFDHVAIVVTFGAIVTGAVTSIKAQQDTDSAMGTAADIEGSSMTVADSFDGKTKILNLLNVAERYVRVIVDRATQNAVVRSAFYIQYGAKSKPQTQGSMFTVETHVNPVEGTA